MGKKDDQVLHHEVSDKNQRDTDNNENLSEGSGKTSAADLRKTPEKISMLVQIQLKLNKAEILTFEDVQYLIEEGGKYLQLDHKIAERFFDAGFGYIVAENLEKFVGVDHSDIARRLIDARLGYIVAQKLEKFVGLDDDIAEKLFDAGFPKAVGRKLEKFVGVDHRKMAQRFFDAGLGHIVAENLEKFVGVDHRDIARRLINSGLGHIVAQNLEKFVGVDDDIARRLIDVGFGEAVGRKLEKFVGVDHRDIAQRLFDVGSGYIVAVNLEKFVGVDHRDIAQRLFDVGSGQVVAANLEKFVGLDENFKKIIRRIHVAASDKILQKSDGSRITIPIGITNIYSIGQKWKIYQEDNLVFFEKLQRIYYTKAPELAQGIEDCIQKNILTEQNKDSIWEYLENFRIITPYIMQGYFEAPDKKEFFAVLYHMIESITGSGVTPEKTLKNPYYASLLQFIFPNNSDTWFNFYDVYFSPDHTDHVYQFSGIRTAILDLGANTELTVKEGQKVDTAQFDTFKDIFYGLSSDWSKIGFDQKEMVQNFERQVDECFKTVSGQKEIAETVTGIEQKLVVLMIEALHDKKLQQQIKKLLIVYQFVKNGDIKTYIQQTTDRVSKARNQDYAYLSELHSFFADHIKEVLKRIFSESDRDGWLSANLPAIFEKFAAAEQKDRLHKLQPEKELNIVQFRSQLGKVLQNTGNPKRWTAAKSMVRAKREKVAAIGKIFGNQKYSDPDRIQLRSISFGDLKNDQHDMLNNRYNQGHFEKYLAQRVNDLFLDEKTAIEKELNKFESKEVKGKKTGKLRVEIVKNKPSAMARSVAGLCVASDTEQWDSPDYLQAVYYDLDDSVCKGLTIMHVWEEAEKKYLVVSMNPSSTYLYSVDEKSLFKTMIHHIVEFAKTYGFEGVGFSTNKNIRTNRTGGEFERAMELEIATEKERLGDTARITFSQPKQFSWLPEHQVDIVDLVWRKGHEPV